MIQKTQFSNSDSKNIFELNITDIRNILEEISLPNLLVDLKNGQVISANHLFSELVHVGIIELTGLTISELISGFDSLKVIDGEKTNVTISLKNKQTLDVIMTSRFLSQIENLALLVFKDEKNENIEVRNTWEEFVKNQNNLIPRLFDLSFTELLNEIIKIGKNITHSDEVVFYVAQEDKNTLYRFPSISSYFPGFIPIIELIRIKDVDIWEPGKRVLSEIHRVGRLNKFDSIITIPISCDDQQFGLIIIGLKNPSDIKNKIEILKQFSAWVSSSIELYQGFHNISQDLLILNKKVEKLEIFFNNSNDCLMLLDGGDQILEFNSNILNLLDYLPIEILNKKAEIIFNKSSILALLAKREAINYELIKDPIEVFDRHGNKKPVFVRIINIGLGHEEKKLIILKDASELRALENNLSTFQKNAALGEMLAEFAHDVRNKINRLTTGLQLIVKKTNPDESVLSSFQNLENEFIGVTELMESVLSFSRQNYENFKSENIKLIVEGIFYQFQKKASQGNISLILNSKDSNCFAWIDQRSLERALNNIINNGIEAIGQGGGALSVNLSNSEEHPGYLLVQVADTGPGIPPEIQSNLFKKYSSGKEGGTGLGLFISQKIIEFHKGWINLETFPGGTIFNIYIPKEKQGAAQ